ncbi:MAG: hypothetical protein MKZ58_01890 [Candidatus Poseidoniaceae archaeon]|nr:hypothetical protein [Candidatus Poseidoniaceae archaeon]
MSDDMEFDFKGLKSLVDDPGSNKTMIAVLAISAIILIYTSVDLSNLNKEVRDLIDSENQWQISFDLDTISFQDTAVLSDGEQRQFDYEISEEQISDGYRVGYITAVISYSETSGLPADPADSVSSTIRQTAMEAQWNDEGNTLSGSSNDASDVELMLQTYPDFDGLTTNGTGLNSYQVLQPWTQTGFGIGTFSVVVELNTQSPPFLNDSDEEVTVTVQVTLFKANANSS